ATDADVTFTLQIDADGSGAWKELKQVQVGPRSYVYELLPNDMKAEWLRVVADHDCHASAYFQLRSANKHDAADAELFAGLATPDDSGRVAWAAGLLRPAAHNRDLLYASSLQKVGY